MSPSSSSSARPVSRGCTCRGVHGAAPFFCKPPPRLQPSCEPASSSVRADEQPSSNSLSGNQHGAPPPKRNADRPPLPCPDPVVLERIHTSSRCCLEPLSRRRVDLARSRCLHRAATRRCTRLVRSPTRSGHSASLPAQLPIPTSAFALWAVAPSWAQGL